MWKIYPSLKSRTTVYYAAAFAGPPMMPGQTPERPREAAITWTCRARPVRRRGRAALRYGKRPAMPLIAGIGGEQMGEKAGAKVDPVIAVNRKARHEFFIEDRLEAGLELHGWEVRSLRAGRAQIAEAYVVIKDGQVWLLGALVTPLPSASTHIHPDPTRTRRLLLHRHEIDRLIGAVERKGYTLIPLRLYWKRGRAKLEIGLAKGKRKHDKRQSEKEKDWQRQKQRILRHTTS